VKLDTGLVIVPFAVPVAVPVATVRQPSVLYGYRGYAAPYGAADGRESASASPSRVPAPGEEEAAGLLTRRCASCHSGPQPQGRLQMFDAAGLLARLPRRQILESVESGRMPLPLESPRLSPAEIDVLRQWSQPPRELVY
jgi:hypothetical protein